MEKVISKIFQKIEKEPLELRYYNDCFDAIKYLYKTDKDQHLFQEVAEYTVKTRSYHTVRPRYTKILFYCTEISKQRVQTLYGRGYNLCPDRQKSPRRCLR